jgi:ubiquinone/menaquinone biosynthesis C-methylase UbiE
MDEKEKHPARKAWETIAERYAARVDTNAWNAYYERPATLSLLPDVAGKRILDAGSGPGVYAEILLDRGATVVGMDLSENMIKEFRKRLGDRAVVHHASMADPLSFLDDNSFDIVLASLSIAYVYDWDSLFKEFARVLVDSGLFIFSTEHPYADFFASKSADYFATELFSFTWSGFGGDPVDMPGYRRPLSSMFDSLANAGFVVDRLIEPRPIEKFKEKDPEDYERLNKKPGFICVRARKG